MTEVNKLQLLRAKKHLTLRELSKLSGVSVSAITNLENGNTKAHLVTLGKLAPHLGVNLEDLLEFWDNGASVRTRRAKRRDIKPKPKPKKSQMQKDASNDTKVGKEQLTGGEIIEHVKTPSERELETKEAAKQNHQKQLESALNLYREGYTSSRTLSAKMSMGKSTASTILRELRANGSIT
jgi:transcriptional regulator with XRE-family HTH domain